MKFEWDEVKYQKNLLSHKIRFEEAQTVFLDASATEFYDDDNSQSEDRFIRVGFSRKMNLLLVVFCERGPKITRIISARKATTKERLLYEEGI